jgi:AraC-like DNA-binding protein
MEINFDLIIFLQLVVFALGIISASVIFYFGIKKNPANLPLAIAQLCASMAIWVSFSLATQLLVNWPVFYRTGQIFVLVFSSMAYLHVDFYTRNRKWKWYDLLHAISLLIYLIDYWHILILPSAEKKELILLEIQDLALMAQFTQSKFFGPNFHHEFRTFIFGTYWIAQVVLLTKWVKHNGALSKYNKLWKNWMLIFLGCQFFIWFPHMLSILFSDPTTSYYFANTISVIWLLILIFSLFFYPSLLYGNTLNRITKSSKGKTIMAIEDRKLEEIMRIIDSQMEDKKLFLKPGYSIHDLSKDIDIPAYQISKCMNTFRSMGFIDYINQKRIHFCISRLDKGEFLNYTLEAVASECGFSNRNSFTKAFKKVMGVSPSEYRFDLENQIRP